ncbi:zinc metalloprotease [Xanthocytophaga flava]|uniref:zinc metalloprotease n=1 Tax=Xanthocytophaga flava TaxID=3048013 RepID=UPI0028D37EB0|nr:zinc metalloprotease [Xanthocytophaga flavus]MDJ1467508.1 zinc metalloprotease [Xanthocytophaga flavus]
MKKLLLPCLIMALTFVSCHKDEIESQSSDITIAPTARKCASMELLAIQLKNDPAMADRMLQIESFTNKVLKEHKAARLVNGVIEIPVVVNVLYRTAAENISDTQIQSQIDALNEDYNATNADFTLVPATFSGVKANVGIRFVLDQTVRKSTNKRSWNTNDYMKISSRGGIDPTSSATKLNLWVCTLSNDILGYAQFPGGASATDGVVILNTAFGRTGTAAAPFNKGRTATHEVGHWLNLRHIWGDATCGTDYVNDTPLHNTANYGCPAAGHKSTCTGTPVEMTMNYMDYTDDACMYMFSNGQKSRMLATFVSGGPRYSFAQ